VALQTYAGVDVRDGKLNINPHLPKHWRSIKFNLALQENHFTIEVSQNEVKVKYDVKDEVVILRVNGNAKEIKCGEMLSVAT
jgi:trehalose/maltose hydrolase-like predicted phosphorylase